MLPFDSGSSHFSLVNLSALLETASLAYILDKDILTEKLKDTFGSREVWHFASDHSDLLRVFPKYTFGQPRVGDLIFRSFYESALGSRSYFVVNNGDIVTRIPPRSIDCMPGLNYATTGRLVFLSGNSATNDAIAWGRYTQSNPVGWRGIPRLKSSVTEHSTTHYLDSIKAAAADLAALKW